MRCARSSIGNALMWLRDYHIDGLRLDAVHALEDHRALHILEELAVAVEALAAQLGRSLVLVAESDLQRPARDHLRGRPAATASTAQWNDDFHHAVHACVTGERQGYYGDFGSLAGLAKTLTRAYFHDGTWSSFRGRSHGRPVDTLRTRRSPLRRLPPGPRPGRQPGHRRPALAAHRAARPAQGRGGAGPDRAVHADAVHGRGVGRRHAVAVLHRSHRSRAGGGGRGRPPGGVRRPRLGRHRRPRPAGRGDVPALQAGLEPAGPASRTGRLLAWYRALLALRRRGPS